MHSISDRLLRAQSYPCYEENHFKNQESIDDLIFPDTFSDEGSEGSDKEFAAAIDGYISRFLEEANQEDASLPQITIPRGYSCYSPDLTVGQSDEHSTGLSDEIHAANAYRLHILQQAKDQRGHLDKDKLKKFADLLNMTPLSFQVLYRKFLNGKFTPLKKAPYKLTKHESTRHAKRPDIEDNFPYTKNFEEDPDSIAKAKCCISMSDTFRKKVFEILQRAGGLKNEQAVQAAAKVSGYERSTLDNLFKKAEKGELPRLKRKLYKFTESDPDSLAEECNKRIRYLKNACFPSRENSPSLENNPLPINPQRIN